MKTRTFQIASLTALVGIALSAVVAACSSDSTGDNTKPTVHQDSGTPNQPDTSVMPIPPASDGGGVDPIDAALPDVGACKSDASTCNSCYTPVQDPVNGCSPAAANCIKFDNTRVPANVP